MDPWADLSLRRLVELDADECLELLGTRSVGRVAYCDDQGPAVLPVNHTIVDGAVVFRTAPYSQLAIHLRDQPAAYEVDAFEPDSQTGWSVLVRGTASYLDFDELPPADQRPNPWPRGQRPLHIRIAPELITGRRLLSD